MSSVWLIRDEILGKIAFDCLIQSGKFLKVIVRGKDFSAGKSPGIGCKQKDKWKNAMNKGQNME